MADATSTPPSLLLPQYTITQNEYAVSDFVGSGDASFKDIDSRIEKFRNALSEYVDFYDVPAQLTINISLIKGTKDNKFDFEANVINDTRIDIVLPTTASVQTLIKAFAYVAEDCWAAQNFHFEKDGYMIEDELLMEL